MDGDKASVTRVLHQSPPAVDRCMTSCTWPLCLSLTSTSQSTHEPATVDTKHICRQQVLPKTVSCLCSKPHKYTHACTEKTHMYAFVDYNQLPKFEFL